MASLKPHRRQFIITSFERPAALDTLQNFKTRQIAGGVFLHHDDELLIEERERQLVLGRMLRDGDGRYVTICDGWLSLDASGSLGVQYFTDGEVICASSPSLLQKFTKRPIRSPKPEIRFSWVAAPHGPVDGSLRLYSDQSLNLLTRERRTVPRTRSEPRTLEDAASYLATEATSIAQALGETGKPLYVALTAGQDSRTIFSALVSAQVPFKSFTMKLSDGASHKDAKVAKIICDTHAVEHIVVRSNRKNANLRLAAYLEHSQGIDGDRGRDYCSGDYYRVIPDDAIVLHGGSLGLSKAPFDYLLEGIPPDSKEQVLGVFDNVFGPMEPSDKEALSMWFDYRKANPIGRLGDHFFLDQRRASWGSDNRFAEDIFGFEWFIFANSWPLIDAFWSVPQLARDELLVQKRAIDIMTPGLNEKVPSVNPPMAWMDRMRGRFSKRGLHKLTQRIRKLQGSG